MEIENLLENINKELGNDVSKQRRRYLEFYKDQLEKYIVNHPGITEVPSPLELYCDDNPEAPECRKYDI